MQDFNLDKGKQILNPKLLNKNNNSSLNTKNYYLNHILKLEPEFKAFVKKFNSSFNSENSNTLMSKTMNDFFEEKLQYFQKDFDYIQNLLIEYELKPFNIKKIDKDILSKLEYRNTELKEMNKQLLIYENKYKVQEKQYIKKIENNIDFIIRKFDLEKMQPFSHEEFQKQKKDLSNDFSNIMDNAPNKLILNSKKYKFIFITLLIFFGIIIIFSLVLFI